MEWLTWLVDNFNGIVASSLIFVAAVDKVVIIALKTVRNIIDAWQETFNPKKF